MIQRFFILILLFINGLMPVTVSAGTIHTAPFPVSMINVTQNLQTQGDGYIPIPYNKDRIYYMNHHARPNALSFGCIDKNTENVCGSGGLGNYLMATQYRI